MTPKLVKSSLRIACECSSFTWRPSTWQSFSPIIIPYTQSRSKSWRTQLKPLPRNYTAKDLAEPPRRVIPNLPAPPSIRTRCAEPIKVIQASQLAQLDPSGARTRLFEEGAPDAARPGDVLLVKFQDRGEPFAGVCLSIKRRGVDTSVLLRNTIQRTATEQLVKIYSPMVTGMEVIERRTREPRRGRLFYMRTPKHDRGSLEQLVQRHLRAKRVLRAKANESVVKASTKAPR